MIHTPPSFSGSVGPSSLKRSKGFPSSNFSATDRECSSGVNIIGRERSGSVSGKLQLASFLCDEGIISTQEKGVVKDLIIGGNAPRQFDEALRNYERGDDRELR